MQPSPQASRAWSLTSRKPERFEPRALPRPLAAVVQRALTTAHQERPFTPLDVRDTARRVAMLVRQHGIETQIIRGGLDIGGAELDHVWVAADGFVLDLALPVNSDSFVRALRAFVAGDLTEEQLDRAAHGHPLNRRVVGIFPDDCAYLGLPLWSQRPPASLGTGN